MQKYICHLSVQYSEDNVPDRVVPIFYANCRVLFPNRFYQFRFWESMLFFDRTDDALVAVFAYVDMYERWLGVADSVFESILDQGDKQKRCDQRSRTCRLGHRNFYFSIVGQSQTHQFYVITHKFHFFLERYELGCCHIIRNGVIYLNP